MSFAVLRAYGLHEAIVTGEIMAYAVTPTGAFLAIEMGIVAGDVVINGAQRHAFARRTENGLRYHRHECLDVPAVVFRRGFLVLSQG